MSWHKRPLAVALAVGALVLAGAGAVVLPRTFGPGEVATSRHMDANRDKVFDSLEEVLATAADAPVPVIVLTDPGFSVKQLEAVVGPVEVTHVYTVVPGFAARLTRDQVTRLSKERWVRQIEYDARVQVQLDSAGRYFGTSQARQDFGVTGDADGDPNRFSREDVVIAIIDTGIDTGHQDLTGKVIAWKDWVNGRTSPYDDHGHGTHVAGIAAGRGAANAAYTGVAPGASLVGLKVLNSAGSGSLSDVQAAVEWCIANKDAYNIRIISMSLGTSQSSDGTDGVSQAVNRAVDSGIVAVVAAGNSGPARYTVGAPGAAARAITVGAMADPGEKGFSLASFSSRGPTRDERTKPDIAAPGVAIMAPKANSGNGYAAYSGTSMATPFVAGTAALILDADPSLTPAQVREILVTTAQDWGPAAQDIDYGYGRLDAYAAVAKAARRSAGSGPAVPAHSYFSGSLTGTGQAVEHPLPITDTAWPLAVTLIMPDWRGSSSPDFDLYVYAPDGSEVGRSTGTTRQETVSRAVSQTGTYRIRVSSYAGSGPYFLDASAGTGGGGPVDNPPAVRFAAPAEGAELSGTARVKVEASDDRGVSKVELAIDDGARQDITGSFDGTYYTYDWDTATAADGGHRLTARATDTGGQVATAERQVTVRNQTRLYEKAMSGTVAPAAPDAWFSVDVGAPGFVDLSLNWESTADLDFYVYAPDGSLAGRAYTLRKPETLRVDTERFGTGAYRVRVNLYSGGQSGFTLTARGASRATYSGTVSAARPDVSHVRSIAYAGPARLVLSWPSGADLDFYVYNPAGQEKGRAYTLRNPETLELTLDSPGDWRVRVNLYAGGTTGYTLKWYAPDAILG